MAKKKFEINQNVLQDVVDHLDDPEYCAMRVGLEMYQPSFGLKDLEDLTIEGDPQNISVTSKRPVVFKKRAERRRRTRNKAAAREGLARQLGYSHYLADPRDAAEIKNGDFGRLRFWKGFWCDSDKALWDKEHLPQIDADDAAAYDRFLDTQDALEDLNDEITDYNKVQELRKIADAKAAACRELEAKLRELMYEENDARNAYLEAFETHEMAFSGK